MFNFKNQKKACGGAESVEKARVMTRSGKRKLEKRPPSPIRRATLMPDTQTVTPQTPDELRSSPPKRVKKHGSLVRTSFPFTSLSVKSI